MATFQLTWAYQGAGHNHVDEILAIEPDGTVWLWLLAAAQPAYADRCGTFTTTADPALRNDARRLAGAVTTLAAVEEAVLPGGVVLTIEAGDQRHQLNPATGGQRQPPIAEALALAERLRSVALAAPRSAVSIALQPKRAQPGQPATVMFEVTSIGTESVKLLFEPTSFAVFGFTAASETFTWRAMEGETMGLLDPDTLDLIDGVLAPATLPAGARALVSFTDSLFADPGDYTLAGSVRGTIAAIRPDLAPALFPRDRFQLTTPQVAWTAR